VIANVVLLFNVCDRFVAVCVEQAMNVKLAVRRTEHHRVLPVLVFNNVQRQT